MSNSGTISLTESTIRYDSQLYGSWVLRLNDVLIIGEMTNEMGPFSDDYFLCFVTSEPEWLEASFYANGSDAFITALCERLGPFQFRLNTSTTFASSILWPPHLAGKAMFNFTDLPNTTLLGRLFGVCRNKQELTPDVLLAMARAADSRDA
jgi:hypothetical protein